jgi:hypothetical protein
MGRKRKKRNRKKRVNGIIFPTNVAVLIIFTAALALGYLWMSTRCSKLGMEIKALEQEGARLDKKLMNEEYKWVSMKSPKNLEDVLSRYGISMTWPRRDQVVWLEDSPIADGIEQKFSRAEFTQVAEVRRGR